MADGKIYIIVTNQLPGGGGEPTPGGQGNQEERERSSPLTEFAQHQFFNLVLSQSKQAIHYTLGNIGNFTGSSLTQEHVNNALSVLGFMKNVGISILAGSKFGPWGAVIAAGMTIIGTATTQGLQIYTQSLENKRQNIYIDQLRTRSGLNSANNGSRGTEY